jgi:hypothetical protein
MVTAMVGLFGFALLVAVAHSIWRIEWRQSSQGRCDLADFLIGTHPGF